MWYVTGQIYKDGNFEEGYLGCEDGIIKETGKGIRSDARAKGIVIPPLVNAHTHIGDAVYKDEITGTIQEVVAPPSGLKHRVLGKTPHIEMVQSMRYEMQRMLRCGIGHFCDFREGGTQGMILIREAMADSDIKCTLFGRPKELSYSREEMKELLEVVDGIGLSAVADWDGDEIKKCARHVKDREKSFALHASEREREDIDFILDLKPDFLIHMNKATDSDLSLCTDNQVPVVLCPRSEVFFGHMPDIPKMQRCGVTLSLGTDNAMLQRPHSILREMEFAYKVARLKGGILADDILRMVLINSRKVLNGGYDICLTQGKAANFIVFQLPRKNPAYALVNGATPQDISLISRNKHIWTPERLYNQK